MKSRKYKIALTNAIAAVIILLGAMFGADVSGDTAGQIAIAVIAVIGYVNGQHVNAIAVEDASKRAAGEKVEAPNA